MTLDLDAHRRAFDALLAQHRANGNKLSYAALITMSAAAATSLGWLPRRALLLVVVFQLAWAAQIFLRQRTLQKRIRAMLEEMRREAERAETEWRQTP